MHYCTPLRTGLPCCLWVTVWVREHFHSVGVEKAVHGSVNEVSMAQTELLRGVWPLYSIANGR